MLQSVLNAEISLSGQLVHYRPRPEMDSMTGRLFRLIARDPLNTRYNQVHLENPAVQIKYTSGQPTLLDSHLRSPLSPETLLGISIVYSQASSIWDIDFYCLLLEQIIFFDEIKFSRSVESPILTIQASLHLDHKGPWATVHPTFHGIKDPAGTSVCYLVAGIVDHLCKVNPSDQAECLRSLIALETPAWLFDRPKPFQPARISWDRIADNWRCLHGEARTS